MPDHLARVRATSAAGDLSGLREAAHHLAGMVAVFSTSTAAVASALEDAAARDDAEACAALVGELGPSCDALLDATVGLSIESLSRGTE
jgi:HPt (histidine-containing phosphotransfer) domain-containing protein